MYIYSFLHYIQKLLLQIIFVFLIQNCKQISTQISTQTRADVIVIFHISNIGETERKSLKLVPIDIS